jgi:hydrogenase maturation protease
MKTLVLGLGNELISDDGVGILAIRRLRQEYKGQADVIETSLHGLALLDFFIGYDKAIIIDAIQTGNHKPGEIIELKPSDLDEVLAPSPHYSGLPEMLAIAKEMDLVFPKEIAIFAIEIVDSSTLGGGLTQAVADNLDELVKRAKDRLEKWQSDFH